MIITSGLIITVFAIRQAQCASISIRVPTSIPFTKPVDHSFPGLGIDGEFLQNYVGKNSHFHTLCRPLKTLGNASSPNTFSRNLIETIANRSGSPVYIRVGGTTL